MTDVASLPEKWRKNAKTGTFTNGSGEAFREALNDCANELESALAARSPAPSAGVGDRVKVLEMFLGRVFAAQQLNESREYKGWKISGRGSLNEVVDEAREYLNCPLGAVDLPALSQHPAAPSVEVDRSHRGAIDDLDNLDSQMRHLHGVSIVNGERRITPEGLRLSVIRQAGHAVMDMPDGSKAGCSCCGETFTRVIAFATLLICDSCWAKAKETATAQSVSPAVAGDGLPPICTCGHCLCPTHDTPLASSAPQGEWPEQFRCDEAAQNIDACRKTTPPPAPAAEQGEEASCGCNLDYRGQHIYVCPNDRTAFGLHDPAAAFNQPQPDTRGVEGVVRAGWIVEGNEGLAMLSAAPSRPVVDEQWRGIFKVVEECGELLQVLGKLGPFPSEPHPDGKGDLRQRAEDELADLTAATGYFITINGLSMERIQPRAESKRDKFRAWGLTGVPAALVQQGDGNGSR